jgi:hypothetical protein
MSLSTISLVIFGFFIELNIPDIVVALLLLKSDLSPETVEKGSFGGHIF